MSRAWDELQERHPDAVEESRQLAEVFGPGSVVRRVGAPRRAGWAARLRTFGWRGRTTAEERASVLGVGVVAGADIGPPVAAVFLEGPTRPLRASSLAVPGGRAHPVNVVQLPRAEAFAGPGDPCDGPTLAGTIGARVTTASGADGVLTAGHVGGKVGAAVTDGYGMAIGTVTFCCDPAQLAAETKAMDVAVIELGAPGVGGLAHATTVATVAMRSDLDLQGAITGHSTSWVMGVCPWWAGPQEGAADWGDVIITGTGASQRGDSGAPVFLAGTDQLVGHVVGGRPGVYSIVQELDDQLGACGARLR